MRFTVLTLFPGMLLGFIRESIIGRAMAAGVLDVDIVNIREFAHDRHQVVDDYPYGGGAGMVMKPDVVVAAIESVTSGDSHVALMTPQGRLFSQVVASEYATRNHVVLVCGHYEGIDERASDHVDDHLSIGDFVLTGGELAAAVVLDATARLVPGVIAEESPVQESFTMGLLEGPQYTRPRDFRGVEVPDVLLSGDHQKVRLWRRKEALKRTLRRRPDMLARAALTREDINLLTEIWAESAHKGSA